MQRWLKRINNKFKSIKNVNNNKLKLLGGGKENRHEEL